VDTVWDGPISASEYLARDRQRLSEGRAVTRAGILTDTSVSVGVAVVISPNLTRRCAARGWPIHRRTTGGTGLLHRPGDLLWSVILPAEDARVGRGFVRSYERYGRPIVQALASVGVDARWTPAFGLSDRFCLFGGRGEVLSAGRRALGGAAQHLTRTGLLHHGTVGAGLDREALTELFDVPGALLTERLTAVGECDASVDLAKVGADALKIWAAEPADRADGAPSVHPQR